MKRRRIIPVAPLIIIIIIIIVAVSIVCIPTRISALSTTVPIIRPAVLQPSSSGSRPNERCISFDTGDFPLRELVTSALAGGDNNAFVEIDTLEQLHLFEPEDFCAPGKIRASNSHNRTPLRRVELLRRALTERWKGSPQKRIWENEYLPRMVREVVGTNTMMASQHETSLIYQRAPMLRFHAAWPLLDNDDDKNEYDGTIPPRNGRNPGTLAAVHTDAQYGHPPGEVNFLLPVTQTFGSNSLYVEGAPNRGDFEPFDLAYGEMMQWSGNNHRHCSPRNISNSTRVSFDFRVIPGSVWQQTDTNPYSSFQLGSYYMDALERFWL